MGVREIIYVVIRRRDVDRHWSVSQADFPDRGRGNIVSGAGDGVPSKENTALHHYTITELQNYRETLVILISSYLTGPAEAINA